MKKLLVLLMVLMLTVPAFANKIGVKVNKTVNAGYAVSLPVNLDAQAQFPFLPKAYIESAMVFTAPRGSFIGAMKRLNHSNFYARIGGEITLLGGQVRLSSGGVNYFEGNNEGVPAGLVMDNEIEYSYNF